MSLIKTVAKSIALSVGSMAIVLTFALALSVVMAFKGSARAFELVNPNNPYAVSILCFFGFGTLLYSGSLFYTKGRALIPILALFGCSAILILGFTEGNQNDGPVAQIMTKIIFVIPASVGMTVILTECTAKLLRGLGGIIIGDADASMIVKLTKPGIV